MQNFFYVFDFLNYRVFLNTTILILFMLSLTRQGCTRLLIKDTKNNYEPFVM